jgi:DNA-binding NtrC family response regulator
MSERPTFSTILIVEDELLVRMHGSEVLEEAGFEVIEAADADEALAILDVHGGIHLLFSDIDMPGSMDGLKLAQRVHERWPHIRLLLTSGHYQLSDGDLPMEGRFLRKPWNQDVLVESVRNFLQA